MIVVKDSHYSHTTGNEQKSLLAEVIRKRKNKLVSELPYLMKSCNKLLIITDWKPLVLMLHANSKTLAKVRERNIFNQKTQCYLCACPLGQNVTCLSQKHGNSHSMKDYWPLGQ